MSKFFQQLVSTSAVRVVGSGDVRKGCDESRGGQMTNDEKKASTESRDQDQSQTELPNDTRAEADRAILAATHATDEPASKHQHPSHPHHPRENTGRHATNEWKEQAAGREP